MTVLRELIARVVLRVDESSIKRLDSNINAVKAHIAQTQAQAQQGIKVDVAVNATEAQKSLAAIRVFLGDIGTAIDPAALAKLQEQFGGASAVADKLRADIDRLKAADPSNPRIETLQKQLNNVESEAKQTAAALDKAKRAIEGVGSSSSQATGLLGQLKNNLGSLGVALSVAGLVGFVHQTLDAAGAVEDFADRLGMSTDEAQTWSMMAKQAGADNEALSASLKGLANAMQGAVHGNKEAAAAFIELGISTDGWKKGLPPLGDQLATVGGLLGEIDDEGKRLALTQKLLSEGGLKLAPVFKNGAEATHQQLDALRELSVVYSEEFIKSAGEAGDELDLFYAQFRGLGAELILTFLPAVRGAVREITPLIRGFRDAFSNSRILTSGLVAAGATGLASFGGIGGALARIAPMLGRIAATAAPFIRGFLRFAAIALILDDFFVMLNGGKSVLGELLSKFELGRTILETFQNGFKLLKGSVLLAWGALSGDEEAMNKGKALLDEFSAWIDGFGSNVAFMFNDLFTRVIPEAFTSGFNTVDEFLGGALSGILDFVGQWASEIAALIGGVWDAALGGLKDLLRGAAELLGNIPGLGDVFGRAGAPGDWQPISPVAQRAKAAMDAGSPYAPSLPVSSTNSSVTVNNNQQITTNIGANNPREVVAAVDRSGRNVSSAITKDNRQGKRFVTGASR
jgi:hypothetical protein